MPICRGVEGRAPADVEDLLLEKPASSPLLGKEWFEAGGRFELQHQGTMELLFAPVEREMRAWSPFSEMCASSPGDKVTTPAQRCTRQRQQAVCATSCSVQTEL